MKKGFTLIELLAVIVILAVIALIATPIILNVIEKARIGSVESSMLGYVDAIEKQVMINNVKNKDIIGYGTYSVTTLTSKGVNVKGDKPDDTSVFNVDAKGKVTEGWATFYEGKYFVYYNGRKAIADTTNYLDEEGNLHNDDIPEVGVSEKTYQVGEAINYDPTTNQSCENPVSTTGTKTGCMKWYVIKDNGNSIDVLLDHNTTDKIAYNTSYAEYENTLIHDQVISDTTGWASGLEPRLITAYEVASITENAEFTESNQKTFYFGTNNTIDYFNQTEEQQARQRKFAWLFDRTNGCINHGCNIDDSSTEGYWTSTFKTDKYDVWYVGYRGYLNGYQHNNGYHHGIRPVITVQKNVLN